MELIKNYTFICWDSTSKFEWWKRCHWKAGFWKWSFESALFFKATRGEVYVLKKELLAVFRYIPLSGVCSPFVRDPNNAVHQRKTRTAFKDNFERLFGLHHFSLPPPPKKKQRKSVKCFVWYPLRSFMQSHPIKQSEWWGVSCQLLKTGKITGQRKWDHT